MGKKARARRVPIPNSQVPSRENEESAARSHQPPDVGADGLGGEPSGISHQPTEVEVEVGSLAASKKGFMLAGKILGLGKRGFWKNCLLSVGFSAFLLLSIVFSSWPITETTASSSTGPLRPEDLPALSLQDPIMHGNPNGPKLIALTFDDGLKPATLDILSILKENNAKATWFVTGRSIEGNEAILKELVSDGDEIGNHTFNHANLSTLSSEQVKEELSSTDQLLKRNVPNYTRYWRPPGGQMNDDVVQTAKSLGLVNVLWSVTTNDFLPELTEDDFVVDLMSVKPGDIVLLHNSPVKAMHNALRRALPELTKQGYRFVTVTELLRAKSE